MIIIKDDRIREIWHRGFNREKTPNEIVIHGTGGGGTYQWVLQGGRKELYRRGIALFHYLIERDGSVTEIIDPDRWVYHSSSGKHDEKTIGIELVNPKSNNSAPYTDEQYKALFGLVIDYLMEKYPISVIVSHNHNKRVFSKGKKKCPGNFDWKLLKDELDARMMQYTENGDGEGFRGIS